MMKIISFLESCANKIGLSYAHRICKKEFYSQKVADKNERPIELAFVFRHLTRLWPDTVLDIGTGMTALPHLLRNCGFMVTATDNIKDYWPVGMINRHYLVINDDITATQLNKTFDFITCVSVLEHIKDHNAAIKSMFSLLNPGGHMILTFPYNEKNYVRNVYELPDSNVTKKFPFITQAFSRKEIDCWLADNRGILIEQEYWQFFTGEYWTCGEMIACPQKVENHEKHHISCLMLTKK